MVQMQVLLIFGMKKYLPLFMAINNQIAKNLLENSTLVKLRDFLLPLLMNGRVKMKNDFFIDANFLL